MPAEVGLYNGAEQRGGSPWHAEVKSDEGSECLFDCEDSMPVKRVSHTPGQVTLKEENTSPTRCAGSSGFGLDEAWVASWRRREMAFGRPLRDVNVTSNPSSQYGRDGWPLGVPAIPIIDISYSVA